ncbi:hypothetical protein CROQUDRAFT_109913 [Cronartium quercuum f. sp. fusiforme G11]|uniref:Inhibitor I9 domain-containing protein n=1 Tax=Cronartium quercuum f. sp. fusiforme G11 TaxID=708437 RepID=A0A9P6NEN6_9BASI|nr:hypothetical protein CROQUDRAFT_109913 [Cronartium quercuum f. sp. fusiforme G11]
MSVSVDNAQVPATYTLSPYFARQGDLHARLVLISTRSLSNTRSRPLTRQLASNTISPATPQLFAISHSKPVEVVTMSTDQATTVPANTQANTNSKDRTNSIITLKPETTTEELKAYGKKLEDEGGIIKHTYDSIIMKGFAVSLPTNRVASLTDDPNVKYVEPDSEVHV